MCILTIAMSAEHDTDGRQLLAKITSREPGKDPPSWSQKRIADALRISQPSVSGWVRGTSRPEPEYREALEHLLGVPRDAWLTSDERKVVAAAKAMAEAAREVA
jgi:hypothetical protein